MMEFLAFLIIMVGFAAVLTLFSVLTGIHIGFWVWVIIMFVLGWIFAESK